MHLRSIDLPRLSSCYCGDASVIDLDSPNALKQVSASASPLACTHLVCAGGFIFGCQANGQLLAVAPGDRKASVIANLDSRPICLKVLGFTATNGIYVGVVTADAMLRVFVIASSMPIGAVISKKKRSSYGGNKRGYTASSSSEDDNPDKTPSTSVTFQQVFNATMSSSGWAPKFAAINSTGFVSFTI